MVHIYPSSYVTYAVYQVWDTFLTLEEKKKHKSPKLACVV